MHSLVHAGGRRLERGRRRRLRLHQAGRQTLPEWSPVAALDQLECRRRGHAVRALRELSAGAGNNPCQRIEERNRIR